jgi:hypothetical protein
MSPTPDAPDFATPAAAQQLEVKRGLVPVGGDSIDVSLWASVIVKLTCSDPASPLAVLYKFTTADGVVIDQGLLSADCSILSGCEWQLPVGGPILILSKVIAGSQFYIATGSNMVVPGKRMLGDFLPYRAFTATIANATPANTFTQMVGNPVDGSAVFADLSGFNGDCDFTARVFTTGGSAQWDFLVEILNLDGTLSKYIYQSLTAAVTQAFAKAHPRAWVKWYVRNTTILTSQAQLELDVFPKALA